MEWTLLAHLDVSVAPCAATLLYNDYYYSAPEDVLAEVDEELLAEMTEMIESGYHEGKVMLEMCRTIDANRERWLAVWHGNARLLDGDGQGILLCCSPWGRKKSDTAVQLN